MNRTALIFSWILALTIIGLMIAIVANQRETLREMRKLDEQIPTNSIWRAP